MKWTPSLANTAVLSNFKQCQCNQDFTSRWRMQSSCQWFSKRLSIDLLINSYNHLWVESILSLASKLLSRRDLALTTFKIEIKKCLDIYQIPSALFPNSLVGPTSPLIERTCKVIRLTHKSSTISTSGIPQKECASQLFVIIHLTLCKNGFVINLLKSTNLRVSPPKIQKA